jgi:hypothetical protein
VFTILYCTVLRASALSAEKGKGIMTIKVLMSPNDIVNLAEAPIQQCLKVPKNG